MTAILDLQRKAAAELGHVHPRPDAHRAWWLWSCDQCSPGLFRAVTRAEPRSSNSHETCPWCLRAAPYKAGVFGHHVSTDDVCRASGMNRHTAAAMLEAAVNNQSVKRGLMRARVTRVEPAPTVMQGDDILARLREVQLDTGRTTKELSVEAGLGDSTLRRWWRDGLDRSPPIADVIRVAGVLGMRIILEHWTGDCVLEGPSDFFAHSRRIRAEAGITQTALAADLDISDTVCRRRERGDWAPRLASATAWARALGGDLKVKFAGVPR